ncbi:MAG: 3,4-dihydroxy-2-butanone-4-phosphate synthase [Candidatus Pacebacteria bacterium]|nr:3,4-dihydroxy-2-butanone-4-phosphate synthase [Candidatus Paceibacterota bacterium]
MTSNHNGISPITEIIAECAAGRMVILMDDEGRENEGDLVIPASFATAEAVNFMAKHGRGLICLTLTRGRVEQLGLPLMAALNRSRHETAFTVSIESREGISTGISAADRAKTISVAIDPNCGAGDIVSPGHVFPLVARDGGVLVRSGHTEAAVDLARLAGLAPAGVICEIMNDDGTMARLPDVLQFAALHGLKVGTIADLIAHRRQSDSLIERTAVYPFADGYGGDFEAVIYRSKYGYGEHLALVKGGLEGIAANSDQPILVRVHHLNILGDVLAAGSDHGLRRAMERIGAEGRGIVVVIRESSHSSLAELFEARQIREKNRGVTKPPAVGNELRYYGIGAQILVDLGVRRMRLLTHSNPTLVGLEGFGLEVSDFVSL